MVFVDGMEDFVAGSGSPLFQAPEVLRREEADALCDVWSYGCVLCCLSHRAANPYHPVKGGDAVELVQQLRLQPVPPRNCPLAAVIELCTELEFEDRKTFEELLPLLEDDATRARATLRPTRRRRSRRSGEPFQRRRGCPASSPTRRHGRARPRPRAVG